MKVAPQAAPDIRRHRAIVRLVLGIAQLLGVTVTLVFLLRDGAPTRPVILGTLLTGVITLTSIVLRRIVWR